MKRRKLNSYRPNVSLALCQDSHGIWYEVITPTGQTIKFRQLNKAREDIRLWYGPEIKPKTEQDETT